MSVPRHYEFPPLLPLGFHPHSMDELEALCVAKFPQSATRPVIMEGFRAFVKNLVNANVHGELWIDGSFVTEKIDPRDIDVVLKCDGAGFDQADEDYQKVVRWVIDNQKAALHCDSYVLFEYPEDDPLRLEGEWWYAFYHARWGFSSDGDPKGIVVLRLNGVAP